LNFLIGERVVVAREGPLLGRRGTVRGVAMNGDGVRVSTWVSYKVQMDLPFKDREACYLPIGDGRHREGPMIHNRRTIDWPAHELRALDLIERLGELGETP